MMKPDFNAQPFHPIIRAIYFTLLCFAGFLSCMPMVLGADGKSMVVLDEKTQTTAKPLFDPGVTSENADQFRASDGSSISGLDSEPVKPVQMSYERAVQNPKIKNLNEKAAEFFTKEREKRQEFRNKIRSQSLPPEERRKKLRDYRQEEVERRKNFAQKQQAQIDKILCDQLETESPACKDKKRFFSFLGF